MRSSATSASPNSRYPNETAEARLPRQGHGAPRPEVERHPPLAEGAAPQMLARACRQGARLPCRARPRHVPPVVGPSALCDASRHAAISFDGRRQRCGARRIRPQGARARHPPLLPPVAIRPTERPQPRPHRQEHLGPIEPGRDARSHGAGRRGGHGDPRGRRLRRPRGEPRALDRGVGAMPRARSPPPSARERRHPVLRRRRVVDTRADRRAVDLRLSAFLVPQPRRARHARDAGALPCHLARGRAA